MFLCWLPFNAMHLALAVQLQLSRVFWLLDTLGVIYLVWAIAEGRSSAPARRAAVAAMAILALSAGRGLYSQFVEFPARSLFAVGVQGTDWRAATAWARTTAPDSDGSSIPSTRRATARVSASPPSATSSSNG